MTNLSHRLFIVSIFLSCAAQAAAPTGKRIEGGIDPTRIEQIAALLPKGPFGFGRPITDRTAWERLAANPAFATVISDAEKRVAEPVPEMTRDVYSEFSRTGQRTAHFSKVRSARYERITYYVLAECVENKGRFIEPLQKMIASICDEPTWVLNFHDAGLSNWDRKVTQIDLGAIVPAHAMAEALYLLGDRLDDKTRELMRSNIRRRILDPYKAAVEGTGPSLWWITAEMNWNAVCTAGVVGAAMGVCDEPAEKAYYVAAAEKFMHRYLAGFGPDGLCAEGMGYWGYGYSNFTLLAEEVWQASHGKLNFYDLPGARLAAMYPIRLEIINGVWPALADGVPHPTADGYPLTFLNRRYALGLARWHVDDLTARTGSLPQTLMLSYPSSATTQPADATGEFYEIRSFFDHGGVLICRPEKGSGAKMGVGIKGGYNDEPHNHNDLGTFITVVGKSALILDPGGEVYTSRTFSKKRYDSKMLNSFGHPVPIIAGKLQRPGKDAVAKIVKTSFTPAVDTLTMDITTAYEVPELTHLMRTFVYSREGEGSLTVTDDVAFKSAQSYAGALITYGQWKQESDGSILVFQNGDAVSVKVDTGGVPFEVSSEVINENTEAKDHSKPTHIAINLKQPVASARVKLTITPAPAPATQPR